MERSIFWRWKQQRLPYAFGSARTQGLFPLLSVVRRCRPGRSSRQSSNSSRPERLLGL
ncbi:hypothetical protein CERZMDRAFT_91065 [Cercospora zeae-maydis SCOH1-5]|uniref:Uncharacterized protein n=1 Tax=Cercospora zeae-maydis SCOH1-5 TaxID=717836 RepID=A0A6A6FC15_9PEZI|nr:hypothetical protein CERZMDRAFT_91065 [Cercospora zeae-maydis SCOH1-5]